MSSVLSGRSSIAWEEQRSLSSMLPDFSVVRKAGGRPVPTGFGARMRSTICPAAGGAANLPGVEEGQEDEEEEDDDEHDVTVVEPEQVGQIPKIYLSFLWLLLLFWI